MSTDNPVKAPAKRAVTKKTVPAKTGEAVTAKRATPVTKSSFVAKTNPRKEVDAVVKKAATETVTARKPVAKPASKPVAKPVTKAVTKPVSAKVDKQPQVAKPAAPSKEKVKKAKLVRDSFTMPETEYQVLNDVKKAFLKSGVSVKKSELLRAGVALIKAMKLDQLNAVISALPPLKAGRPKKDK